MKKTFLSKKLSVLVLAFLLVVSAFGVSSVAYAAADNSVTVVFQTESINDSGDAYFIAKPMTLNVTPGYAATIDSRMTNDTSVLSSTQVSVLDVLYAAHEAIYGSSFTNNPTEYIDGNVYDYEYGHSVYITKIFEQEMGGTGSSGIMFAVNDVQPHSDQIQEWEYNGETTTGYVTYAASQSVVQDGDVINFFAMQDASYQDLYVQFYDGETADAAEPTREITAVADVERYVWLKSYEFFNDGYKTSWNYTVLSDTNADIMEICDVAGNAYQATLETPTHFSATFADGRKNDTASARRVKLTFSTPGTYYISAKAPAGQTPLTPAYLKVVVTAK